MLLLVTVGCMVGGILLRGIPGVAFMALASPFLRLFYGKGWLKGLNERAWRVAKRISLLWPLAIFPAVRLAPRFGPFPFVAAFVIIVAWGLLVTIVLVSLARGTVAREAGPRV